MMMFKMILPGRCLIMITFGESYPGGVVSQGSRTVPPTKPLTDLMTGPVILNDDNDDDRPLSCNYN